MNVTNPEIFNLSLDTTYDVDFANMTKTLIISGANTSVNVVGTSGTAQEYTLIDVIYLGSITGGGTLQIFGINIPSQLLTVSFKATALYYSGAWTLISIGSVGTAFVNNANVVSGANIAVNKLAALTSDEIPQINSSGVLEASGVASSFLALLGALTGAAADYNKVAAFTGTTADLDRVAGGSWTAAELEYLAGVTSAIQSQLNAKANIADFTGVLPLKYAEIVIPSAQVLTGNTTPVAILGAPAPSDAIEILYCSATMVYAGVAYTTNGVVQIRTQGATVPQIEFAANQFLFGTASRTVTGSPVAATLATETQIIAGAPIEFFVETGNPAAGTSDITIRMIYYEG
jgi:hypothetical protein